MPKIFSHLTIVPLGCEPTLSNMKKACTNHFKIWEMECDLLAGERGPSFTDISMITNWKVLHIRFIPKSNEVCDPSRGLKTRKEVTASPEVYGRRNGAKFKESKSLPTSTANLQFNIFFLDQQ